MDLRARTLLTAGDGLDRLTKFALGSALAAAMAPDALRRDGAAEARRLEFYATLASSHDPDKIFTPPPSPIPVHVRHGHGLENAGGQVELLRFHSPFAPLHPDLRDQFQPRRANATARAQHWRHNDGPRPTLLVTHGFSASGAALNARVFALHDLFEEGWDILLYTLPFHGSRQNGPSPFNGAQMFMGGFASLAESLMQAICDLRTLLDLLERRGATRIGATGISLGGYVTALLAAVDTRLDFVITNSAVSSIPPLIERWFPAQLGMAALERIKHIPADLIARSAAIHSPLNYPGRVPRERMLIIAGEHDRVAPPDQSLALWEHWRRPEIHWFPGSHVLHFGRDEYMAAVRRTMGSVKEPPLASAALAQPVPLRPPPQSM